MFKLTVLPFELPFKHPFSISRKSKSTQPLVVVKLENEHFSGLGEATANSYYDMTVARLQKDLEAVKPILEQHIFTHPEQLWTALQKPLQDNPFALCAIDQAAWDIYAKQQNKKLYEVWNLDISDTPLTDYTIGIDTVEKMVEKMKEFPWPVYKIKLGTDDDVGLIRALRKETSATFRVDANCAWTLEQTIEYASIFKDLGVEFIEQPMPDPGKDKNAWAEVKEAFKQSALPLIADESCITEEDVAHCHGHFHGINIKLVKCGGLTPALRMIKEARQKNMKLMVGSMNESTVGSSAAAHLLPYLDYIDMDGPLLQSKDTATGITFENGKIIFADRPGTGAELINV